MKKLANLVIVVMSTIFSFVIINLFFFLIYNQEIFPRDLVRYGGNLQYSFYPSTYDFDKSRDWTAIVGDSYAQGMGDAFLDGKFKYSSAHYLNERIDENFLIFGGSGFGSINAVRELINNLNIYQHSWIFPNLDKPKEIFLFFYEGNDLNNNVAHMQARMKDGESIEHFVGRMIGERPDYWYIDANLPFTKLIYRLFHVYWMKFVEYESRKSNETVYSNSLSVSGNSVSVGQIQSAAVELSEEEMEKSLMIVFSSVKYLLNWSNNSKVTVVYLPSVVSSYFWNEPIEIVKYSSNEIRFTTNNYNQKISKEIRNKIREYCVFSDCDFIDTTSIIVKLGESQFVHGPKDWNHFNLYGYSAVASEIIGRIDENKTQ